MRRGMLAVTGPVAAGLTVAGLAVGGLAVARPAQAAGALAPAAWAYLKPLTVWVATIALALCVIAGVTVARLRRSQRPDPAGA